MWLYPAIASPSSFPRTAGPPLDVYKRQLLDMDLGVAISIGMLLGALIGQQVPKKKETNPGGQGQTTAQDGDEVSPDAPRDESAQSLGQEDDHEKH